MDMCDVALGAMLDAVASLIISVCWELHEGLTRHF